MQGYLHSMTDEERSLALAVLSSAFSRLPPDCDGRDILACVQAAASLLPHEHRFVTDEYAQHVAEAAVWYLDRATRRLGDPDRDGHTPQQRAANLELFAATAASPADLEALFAMAAALNADDA
jgi:hypothetical protein